MEGEKTGRPGARSTYVNGDTAVTMQGAQRTCRHLNRRTLDYCGAYADFVIDVGFSGVAACRKHLGSLVIPAMGGEGLARPEREARIVPTHLWVEQ